jgi:hypothetical protein
LVSNRVDWHAQRILTLYVQRWPIELFQSQDIKFTRDAFFGLDHGVGHLGEKTTQAISASTPRRVATHTGQLPPLIPEP